MKRLILGMALLALPAIASAQNIPKPSTEALLQVATEFEQELTGNILPYWIKHAPNSTTGGFYGQVGLDGKADTNAERGALLSSRILWSFSAAYREYNKDPAYKKMADLAFQDLEQHFWDKKNGGLYWSITGAGKPAQTHKQIYGQVFGIYGYSEYARATGNQQALERAKTLYQLIEKNALDKKYGGYVEVLAEDWTPQTTLHSSLGAPTAKSQNTHLHVMEAYTNLLRVWPDAGLKKQQKALIELMLGKILNSKTHHLALHMDADWTIKGDEISYGHDIEAAWLLVEAATVLDDASLIKRTQNVAVKITDVTLAEGLDSNGAIFNLRSPKGLVDANKDWWAQAEALVGFINAYEITGDTKYFMATMQVWGFIKAHLINTKTGEWYWGTDRVGKQINQPTISMWKCPYHNSRAMMESARRLQRLGAIAKVQ
ncbi:MAG TPA: AGE family epimerase/isomerase [Cellvibrio sp.]|nr:AGE family epimerase/isomerase [Cellvibrio sp.]